MIDLVLLENSIKDVLSEDSWDDYDFDNILRSAMLVWDDTAIRVVDTDFKMCFDIVTYELLQYVGNDIGS